MTRSRARLQGVLRFRLRPALALACGLAAVPVLAAAQAREVTTAGFDAQRSNWVRTDVRINRDSVSDGSFQFLWKHTYPGEPRQLQSLTQPVLLDFLVGYVGFKSLAFFGGADDVLHAIDTDLATPYWTSNLTYAAATAACRAARGSARAVCRGADRWTPRTPTAFGGGRGGGGGRATSAVGEPARACRAEPRRDGRGAGPPSGDAPPPPPAGPARNVPGVPFGGVDPVWAIGSDGLLRTLRITDGGQIDPPVPFLPPNARPSSVVYVDGLVYTSTSNGCGNAPNAVWGIDLCRRRGVATWSRRRTSPSVGVASARRGSSTRHRARARRAAGLRPRSAPPRYANTFFAPIGSPSN